MNVASRLDLGMGVGMGLEGGREDQEYMGGGVARQRAREEEKQENQEPNGLMTSCGRRARGRVRSERSLTVSRQVFFALRCLCTQKNKSMPCSSPGSFLSSRPSQACDWQSDRGRNL